MNNVRPLPCCVLPSLVNDHLSMNNIRPQPCQMQPPPSRVRRSQIFSQPLRVNSIPAVSGTSPRQKHQLDLGWRIAARHPIVSGNKPSPLFWFTTSDLFFEQLVKVTVKGAQKEIPMFLEKPELVFEKIWATPADSEEWPVFQSLIA